MGKLATSLGAPAMAVEQSREKDTFVGNAAGAPLIIAVTTYH